MLEFQSEVPDLRGARCEALIAQEFWYAGERVSSASVLYLKTEAAGWHRVAIDGGVLFWRVEAEPSFPRREDSGEEFGQHPLVDLGERHALVGRQIERVRVVEAPEVNELQFEFSDGIVVALRDFPGRDATDLEIRPPAA